MVEKTVNPFDPNFGKIPKIYLGRQEIVNEVVESLKNGVGPYQTSLIYGMRGVGKTSLLADITKTFEEDDGWIVVYLAMTNDLMTTLIQSIYQEANSSLRKSLNKIEGVTFSALGFELGITVSDPHSTYQVLLEEMLKKLKKAGKSLLIAIDEVKATEQVINLASIYQIMVLKKYPINIMMTGLPKNVSELQNNDVLTFLLRSGRIPLGPLNLFDVRFRYSKAFQRGNKKIDNEILTKVTQMTKGYAYAFQDLGYYLWQNSEDVIDENTLEESLPEFKNDLFRNAYVKITNELSATDRKILLIMAKSNKEIVDISYIREKLGKTPGYMSAYRRRLLDSQIIIDVGYGKIAFSLPFMKEFILEEKQLYDLM
ncbi:ATP-binding protein [Lactobacillus hamsteri]|uniref:ATPase domain-containing protein n=1 Tax=Lactobacillus hamsteri DSM 5661 = JCM 6256 TaxID=1423754 RepID=A0A0R1Y5A2_9LACO|nr:ATP-binding protein [Lactobacillus hamsteri]KRM37543.1 hypothetical protein FC39_GL000119 [Lactobacillus hamsteri DSM 5661 = JCM 6256]